MIPRHIEAQLRKCFEQYPVVTLTGPRQSGKTTLVRATFRDKPYANLEHPSTREFAQSDPEAFLAQFPNELLSMKYSVCPISHPIFR